MSIIDAFRLDGKVAVVTGANTGLGQGMSVALAQEDPARILRSLLKVMEENLLRL